MFFFCETALSGYSLQGHLVLHAALDIVHIVIWNDNFPYALRFLECLILTA